MGNAGTVAPTKIIGTIGPASDSEETVKRMVDEGMAIARVNFSHGTVDSHRRVFELLNRVRGEEKYCTLAIAVDTKGPEIRTGSFPNGPVVVSTGDRVELTTDRAYADKCSQQLIFVDHPNFITDLEKSACRTIYIDDGKLELAILSVDPAAGRIRTEAKSTATVSSKKGVNLPGATVSLPGITEKDKEDILFGVEHGADFIFASFVRTSEHLQEIKALPGVERLKVIAKIESQEGLSNLDSVIEVADGVMVARGDLGIETDYAGLFFHQCLIAAKCRAKDKPYLVATQMLDSLERAVRPTRAEITDVGLACAMSAGCVMLSGETASGCNPVNAVAVMQRILLSTASQLCANQSVFELADQKKFSTTIKVVVSKNKQQLRALQLYPNCFPCYSATPASPQLPLLPPGYTLNIDRPSQA